MKNNLRVGDKVSYKNGFGEIIIAKVSRIVEEYFYVDTILVNNTPRIYNNLIISFRNWEEARVKILSQRAKLVDMGTHYVLDKRDTL